MSDDGAGPAGPASDARVTVCGGLAEAEAQEALLVLVAAGLAADLAAEPGGTIAVVVAGDEWDRAGEMLAEARAEKQAAALEASEAARSVFPEQWRWLGPGAVAVALVALVCVGAFLWTTGGGPEATYDRMLSNGAITAARIDDGEVWRLLT